MSVLSGLGDPRARRGRRYDLVPLVAAAVAATLAGASSFVAIASWLADQDAATATALGFCQRASDAGGLGVPAPVPTVGPSVPGCGHLGVDVDHDRHGGRSPS
ncbi:transposase family protein [Nostocoides australiense]|nr:transposase family protein [Actinomycetota bacterium]HRV67595.1 transposase family protein [Candidatus Nanopelagicales bacterium]